MTMIALLHADPIRPAVRFDTEVLGFTCEGFWPEARDPGYAVLLRDEGELHVSSHRGDGRAGQAAIILAPG
ncbi:MAG: hypothetical protein HXY23_10330 [Parvularculaceae bacterium]|nr:hypothetical protein [Parvularculaceae bacterium]